MPPKGSYWRGYLKTETFNRDDFEFAEEQTEKFFSNENKRPFGSYYTQHDIEFLRHAKSAKSKLFLGFDPRDVPSDTSENKKPPWKRASSDMKPADNSVMAPSEPANDTQATSQPLVEEKPKPKNETAQPKKRRRIRVKKYEVPVAEYLINLREEVLVGIVPSAKVANLTAMDIAECLAKKDEFKNLKIDSIEQKVRRSEAWRNRNETFKPIYDTATFRNQHSGKTPYQDVQSMVCLQYG